jgi:hypothetical protein
LEMSRPVVIERRLTLGVHSADLHRHPLSTAS